MPMNARLLRPLATGFDPRRISGLAVWFDASDATTITLNSGNVSQWRDRSGNNRHLTQTDAAQQPSYSIAALNGKNVVVAQDTVRPMRTAAFAAGLPNTIFVVASSTGSSQGIFQRGSVNDVHSLWRDTSVFRARRGSGNEATAATANGYQVFTCVFTKTLARLFVGNTQGTDNTADVTGGSADPTGTKTLSLFNLDSIFGLVGGIAEFIYYDGELSSAQQGTVRRYLSSKWNVTL